MQLCCRKRQQVLQTLVIIPIDYPHVDDNSMLCSFAVGSSLSDRLDILMQDCREAMLFCLEAARNFYKPRYHLAKLHLARGEPDSALSQLKPLINRSGKGNVWFYMKEITEDIGEGGSVSSLVHD